MISFRDRRSGEAHSRFQNWRKRNPQGFFINRTGLGSGRLHVASCRHPDDTEWKASKSKGSLTKKQKVCARTIPELERWAESESISIDRCKGCPLVWIFQALPKRYNLPEQVQMRAGDWWTASRFRDEMRKGDTILFWQSGDRAGICAKGTISSKPYQEGREWRVDVEYTGLLKSPVLKERIQKDPRLRGLSILRQPQGTNFRVTLQQWEALRDLIADAGMKTRRTPLARAHIAPRVMKDILDHANLSDDERRAVAALCDHPCSATGLTKLLGLSNYRRANQLLGNAGRKVFDADPHNPVLREWRRQDDYCIIVIVTLRRSGRDRKHYWEIRPEVKQAFVDLGWYPPPTYASPISSKWVDEVNAKKSFNPRSTRDARRLIETSIVCRRGQRRFREQLMRRYGRKCIITGCDAEWALEAAHICPYKGDHTDDPTNGLLLRADLHTLFDLYLIAIDTKTLRLLLAPSLTHTTYARLDGKRLSIPKSCKGALDKHREEFQARQPL